MADTKPVQLKPDTHALLRQMSERSRRSANAVVKRALVMLDRSGELPPVPTDDEWADQS